MMLSFVCDNSIAHSFVRVCVGGGAIPFQGEGLVFQQLDW